MFLFIKLRIVIVESHVVFRVYARSRTIRLFYAIRTINGVLKLKGRRNRIEWREFLVILENEGGGKERIEERRDRDEERDRSIFILEIILYMYVGIIRRMLLPAIRL